MSEEPKLILGGVAYDDRGSVSFVNDFDFQGIKRFYQVENISKDVVRAFHGHLHEGKFVYVAKGSVKVICAKIENEKLVKPLFEFVLNSRKPSVLKIPKGFANGFKVLEENTSIIFFSISSLEESKNDDIRFAWNIFGKEIWEIKNR
ncbi:MAG: dTDP-4-dehydrorhamnose 3,5-epimerase family protein [Nanoarchaeota archaeon]|nr:dTDP-4-dehydrorhamnose 3,5-epimerase family protein [Nanoarchaeota archaeon]